MTNTTHIVALSGGKDSTAMALRLAEVEPRNYEYIITPTGNELPEMIAHWVHLGDLLGKPLKPISSVSLQGLIRRYNALPNFRMRWCTRQIKIEPYMAYALKVQPAVSYVGIRADEAGERTGTDYSKTEGVTQRFPLVEWGWGLAAVKAYLKDRGIIIPRRTDCAMCFFQTLPEWWLLWRDYPEQYTEAEQYEEMVGHTLRSDSRDTWPASLRELRARFEAGDTPRNLAKYTLPNDVSERPRMCSFCAR